MLRIWSTGHQYVIWLTNNKRIYDIVNNVIPQMLHNTSVEVEYWLDIPRANNGSHVEVYGT